MVSVDFDQNNNEIHWLRRDMATDSMLGPAKPNEVLHPIKRNIF